MYWFCHISSQGGDGSLQHARMVRTPLGFGRSDGAPLALHTFLPHAVCPQGTIEFHTTVLSLCTARVTLPHGMQ
jgi:hypothetical protein